MGKEIRNIFKTITVFLAVVLVSGWAKAESAGLNSNSAELEREARDKLAKKLLKLSQMVDMKEATFKESGQGPGNFNPNDANSYSSRTTYHSYVWSYCMHWIGGQYCQKWLDPYIAGHGLGGDKSDLEGAMGGMWQEMKGKDEYGKKYGIWSVERPGGGSNLDADGKFEKRGVTDWRLLPKAQQEAANVGDSTAVRQIQLTYDDNAGKGSNLMPNMESLRLMGSRWTKMFRNRMVANIGELRAIDEPVEVALGADKAECEDYVREVKQNPEVTRLQERIQAQPVLQPTTQSMSLDARAEACRALRKASAYMVNPQYTGKGVEQGDPDGEVIDKWRSRLNLMAIDYAGADVQKFPKPKYARLKREDLSVVMKEYEVGGRQYRYQVTSPLRQLQSYNNNLDVAAIGMKGAAARSPWIKDNGEEITKFKIAPGGMSAVRINHLTPEMRKELERTGYPGTNENKNDDPTLNLERSPAELSQRAKR